VKRRKSDRPVIGRPAPAIRPMRAKTRRLSSRRDQPAVVRLAVHEEHRCPFCLEPVKRNDPRGVVECQVCHTLHHKDCWDITGSCQVPHLNT
jgi:ribosomal protein L37AE/L43A